MNRKNRGREMFSSSKNGQVTIFIIIGIILLFTFAGIMYFTSNTISEKISSEGEPVIQNAPSEFSAIQTFTQDWSRHHRQRPVRKIRLALGRRKGPFEYG